MKRMIKSVWDVKDQNLEPPDNEYSEVPEFEEYIEFELDNVEILVDEDGSFDFVDNETPWAYGDLDDGGWSSEEYSKAHIEIADVDTVQYDTGEILARHIPKRPGKYAISGDVLLVYEINGLSEDVEYYDEDDYDVYYYTDNVYSTFVKNESRIANLKIDKLS